MNILLTNDDGIYAPGLAALYRELKHLGEVLVVAPESEQSAVGHAITLMTPLRVKEVSLNCGVVGLAVSGFPADCVKIALAELLPNPPDLVVSGVTWVRRGHQRPLLRHGVHGHRGRRPGGEGGGLLPGFL